MWVCGSLHTADTQPVVPPLPLATHLPPPLPPLIRPPKPPPLPPPPLPPPLSFIASSCKAGEMPCSPMEGKLFSV